MRFFLTALDGSRTFIQSFQLLNPRGDHKAIVVALSMGGEPTVASTIDTILSVDCFECSMRDYYPYDITPFEGMVS
jgi:hypothetical protein